MLGHSHTRAMLPIPIRMEIDEGSMPTNCRILDGEVHDPASIRTVRKNGIPFLESSREVTHMLPSGSILDGTTED